MDVTNANVDARVTDNKTEVPFLVGVSSCVTFNSIDDSRRSSLGLRLIEFVLLSILVSFGCGQGAIF